MNKFLTTVLIMMIGALGANAQMVSSSDVKTAVASILETNYRKMTNGDVEVKVSATPFAQLQLPDGRVNYKIVSGGDEIVREILKGLMFM